LWNQGGVAARRWPDTPSAASGLQKYADHEAVTEKVRGKARLPEVDRAMDASRLWYCRSLKENLRFKEAGPEKRAKHEALRNEFLRRQHRALERATAVKPYPKYTELAAICSLSARQVRYALKKCRGKIAGLAGM